MAADSQYAGGRPCTPASRASFRVNFNYVKQRSRVVRRPRARRRFAVYVYVSTPTRVSLRVVRGGITRLRVPRRGTLIRQGGFKLSTGRRGLRAGLYQLRLTASSAAHNQRVCVTRSLRVRR
jgi:hypothetical protein